MWLMDLFCKITDVIVDIWFGKRYGWGSFLWNLAAGVCFVIAVIFIAADRIIPGIIVFIVSIFFSALGWRRLQRDIRRKKEQQAKASQEMETP